MDALEGRVEEAEGVDESVELPLEGVGDRLRRAREEAGMSLAEVAAETRIPERHLAVIDDGRFEDLPARTYAVGFSRSYAKAVGLNEREIAEAVRAELGTRAHAAQRADNFEPGDPTRVPSRRLAWFSLFAAVLLVAGLFMFYRSVVAPGSGPASILADEEAELVAQAEAPVEAQAPAPVGANAPVTFTALRDGVWVRIYDANYSDTGEPLLEKQMALGETYTVPADVEEPQIRTGWPAALEVSVAGDAIGRLSQEDEILSDVDITAPALVERIEANQQAAAEGEPDEG